MKNSLSRVRKEVKEGEFLDQHSLGRRKSRYKGGNVPAMYENQ